MRAKDDAVLLLLDYAATLDAIAAGNLPSLSKEAAQVESRHVRSVAEALHASGNSSDISGHQRRQLRGLFLNSRLKVGYQFNEALLGEMTHEQAIERLRAAHETVNALADEAERILKGAR